MLEKLRPAAAAVIACTLAFSGCVPSDAQIETELAMSRRMAYEEWKSNRDRGGSGETKADGPLSLDDAIRLALQYNKSLMAYMQNREITRGSRISYYSVILPSMVWSAGMNRYENKGYGEDLFRYSSSLRITQPIWQGQRIPSTLTTARLNTALTDENIRYQVETLITNVAMDYYNVLLSQKLMETYQEGLTSAEAQYRVVAEKKKQETATEYDVLSAQVAVANYQAQVQNAKNSIDTNRVTLLKDMGVSQDSEIIFSDQLTFLPMRPVFERAVEIAVGLKPDLRIAELNTRIACEAVAIAESYFWPSVAASFAQGWTESGRESVRLHRDPWVAGLTATYSLGIDTYGDLVSAKAKARMAQLQMLDTQESMVMQIRLQMNALANAEETVRYLEVNQDAAREALRLVEVGYQAGVKTEVDVTDARKSLMDVMGQYYQALYNHTKARLDLQVAMGLLGPARVVDGTQLPPAVPIANIEEFAATDYQPPVAPPMPEADPRPPRTPPARGGSLAPSGNRDQLLKEAGRELEDLSKPVPGKSPTSQSRPAQSRPMRPAQTVRAAAPAAAPAEYSSAPTDYLPNVPIETSRAANRAPTLTGGAEYVSMPLPAPVTVSAPIDMPVAPPAVVGEPAQAKQAEEPQPRPMFRVKVREGAATTGPDVAKRGM